MHRTLLLAPPLVLLASLTPPAASQNVLATLDGDDLGDRLGWNIATAGDVDGDGVTDLIAGAPRDDDNGISSGSARVYSGIDGSVIDTTFGVTTSDQYGFSVGAVGDVDGDGLGEVVVGAPFNDNGGTNAGMARIVFGDGVTPWLQFAGGGEGDGLGHSVRGAGDVNMDGELDVILGAPQDGTVGPGYARIHSAETGALVRTLTGIDDGSQFGISVAGVGDLDVDGFDEVVVGAFLDDTPGLSRGRAYVFDGETGDVMYTFDGEADFDWFGFSVDAAGDTDDDGFGDIVVGAYGHDTGGDTAGRVYIFSGKTGDELLTVDGEAPNANLGWSVDGVPDTNDDGHSDVVAGAPFEGTGRARVLSGCDGSELLRIVGDVSGDVFGRGVAGLGDINDDGHGDFAVGAPLDDDNGTSSGRVTLVSGYQPWADLGNGLPGTNGTPELVGSGTLIGGELLNLALTGGPANGSLFFVLGFSELSAPFKGGVLVPSPDLLLSGLPLDATGALSFSFAWPLGVPAGVESFYQDWMPDPGGVFGFSASNGVRATTP